MYEASAEREGFPLSKMSGSDHGQASLRKLCCVTVCHTVYMIAQTAFLADVHYNESLVWFEASGFFYTVNTGSSMGLLSDKQLLQRL